MATLDDMFEKDYDDEKGEVSEGIEAEEERDNTEEE